MESSSPSHDDNDDRKGGEDGNNHVGDGNDDDDDDGSMDVFQQSVLTSIHEAERRSGGSLLGGRRRRQSDSGTSVSAVQSSRRTQPLGSHDSSNSNSTSNSGGSNSVGSNSNRYNTEDANASSSMMSSTIVNDNTLGASRFGGGIMDNEDESRYDPNPRHHGSGGDYGRQQPQQPKRSTTSSATSLFGAVMRQFGNNSYTNENSDNTDDNNNGRPTKRTKFVDGGDADEQQRVHDGRTTTTTTTTTSTTTAEETNMAPLSSPSTMFTTLSHKLGSPVKAGKSLMSLLKGANSPFKFRSPQLMKNKKKKNKRMTSEDAATGAAAAAAASSSNEEVTKKKKNRGVKRRLELDPSKNPVDLNVGGNENRIVDQSTIVAHKGERDDDHEEDEDDEDDNSWVELPIVGSKSSSLGPNYGVHRSNNPNTDVPFLDWSIKTRIRLEWHRHEDDYDDDEDNEHRHRKQKQRIIDPFLTQNLIASEQWKDATTYYEFQTTATIPRTTDNDLMKSKPQLLRRTSSSGGAMRIGSTNTQSGNESRHGFGDNTSSAVPTASVISSFDIAKDLVRKVQGSKVQFSRQLCMDARTILQPGMLLPTPPSTDDNPIDLSGAKLQHQLQQQRRQWRQAFRSLYSNFCNSIQLCCDDQDLQRSRTALLDTFFYCVGEEHVVVFRAIHEEGNDNTSNYELTETDIVPTVMISDCSASFRQELVRNGCHLFGIHTSTKDTDPVDDSLFDVLYDVGDDRNSKKKDESYPSSPSPTAKKKSAISPSTKADLEALRRARIFGESAGADVFVKIKNGGKDRTETNKSSERNDKKAICCSGWDQIGLFFEVYLNTYGDVLCSKDDTNDDDTRQQQLPALFCPHRLGPFSNCTEKQLSVFPVPNPTTSSKGGPNAIQAIDVCGMILPTAIRQMILTAGKPADLSRSFGRPGTNLYLVLHTFRGKNIPSSLHGLQRSFVFNQNKSTTNYKNVRRTKHGDDDDSNNINDDGTCCFECPAGKVLQLAVWDNGKSSDKNDTVAFRLEDVQTSLLLPPGPRRRSSIQ